MTFDVKKYPGYTEMIFKNRKSTLTRKKALATFLTSDNLEVSLYDFYNKYHFFMKFDGFEPMINIYDDLLFRAGQLDGIKEYYEKEFSNISLNEIEEKIAETVSQKQSETLNPEYLDFCKDYIKRKGLDIPEAPEVEIECHLLNDDEEESITYTPVEMEDETETREEQNEIAPLSFNENEGEQKATSEEDEWAGFLPEGIYDPEENPQNEVTEKISETEPVVVEDVTPNFKEEKKSKKSKKKSGKKKSKK